MEGMNSEHGEELALRQQNPSNKSPYYSHHFVTAGPTQVIPLSSNIIEVDSEHSERSPISETNRI